MPLANVALENVALERSSSTDDPIAFELPASLEAMSPPEMRGTGRDDVQLLVSTRAGLAHAHFRELPDFLRAGDLIVLNRSATIPAALTASREDGSVLQLHISTQLPADLYLVELREALVEQHERLRLPGGAMAELLTPYRASRRLWVARLFLPAPFGPYLASYGRPVTYRHIVAHWPLDVYQNVFAQTPGSAEMPSAGRPFTNVMLDRLRERGVGVAFVTLHAGVSSPERDEPPYEELYEVPAETARAVRHARRKGGRVIATGTTVVRALESSLDEQGQVVASRGWTDLVIALERGVRTIDGLLTGFHEPRSSHLAMLEAIAGRERIEASYDAALAGGYLWHEFGDSHLIMP
jgi:S-adenosylmethionine:tRNA ribosyltransferase-isomerase